MALPQGPNQRWSLDFLSDAMIDGRRFRVLAIVDSGPEGGHGNADANDPEETSGWCEAQLWHLQEDAPGMVFWHLPELTVGIAVDDMEGSYEVSDDGNTRAFRNCDGDHGAGRGLRDFRAHLD
jgi:hypothetical protein